MYMHPNMQPANYLLVPVGQQRACRAQQEVLSKVPPAGTRATLRSFQCTSDRPEARSGANEQPIGPLGQAALRPGRLGCRVAIHSQPAEFREAGRDTRREWTPLRTPPHDQYKTAALRGTRRLR